MKIPSAGIIVIGNEILSGNTREENIPFLAKRLYELGIKLEQVHIIGDNHQLIVDTVENVRSRYDYVFTTGGIGPTHDDITVAAVAEVFKVPLEKNKHSEEILALHYGRDQLTEARLRMTLIPKGSTLIPNHAVGFKIENVYVLAGVPSIMRAMFDEIVSELIKGPKIYSNAVYCQLGESLIADELSAIQSRYQTIDIGSYPYYANRVCGLNLVLRGIDRALVLEATEAVSNMIKAKGELPKILINS